MKWPFVRRSKYDSMVKERDEQKGYEELWEEKYNNLLMSNTSNLVEINRINQELASELNSHRETKECFEYTIDGLRIHNNNLEKELEETKEDLKKAQEHEQKLFEAHDKLNQQNMGLLYEAEEWKKVSDYWMGKASKAKSEILKVRGYLKIIAKKL